MLIADGYSVFLNLIFLLAAGLTVLMALNYLPRAGLDRGEFYFLLLFTVTGMMLMAQAGRPDHRLPGARAAVHPALHPCPPLPGPTRHLKRPA